MLVYPTHKHVLGVHSIRLAKIECRALWSESYLSVLSKNRGLLVIRTQDISKAIQLFLILCVDGILQNISEYWALL